MTPTDTAPSGPSSRGPAATTLGVVRFATGLFALVTLALWGYLAWSFPWPAIAFMIGAPLFAIIVWALFRAPQAVIATDAVGKAIVEIAVMGAATAAWFQLGHPIVGVVFAVVAAVTGVLTFRREARTS